MCFCYVLFNKYSILIPTIQRYKAIRVSPVNKDASYWNFHPNSGLRKFRHSTSIVTTCRQLSTIKMDAYSVVKWRPSSSFEQSLQYRLLGAVDGQYVILGVHLSLKHNACMGVRTLLANGVSWPFGKVNEKLKSENMQKAFFWMGVGVKAGVENGAMLTTCLFRYTPECTIL